MFTHHRIIMTFILLFVLACHADGFFWGTSENSSPAPYPHYFYQQRLLQGPSYPSAPQAAGPLPSVPIHVPLQAGLAPMPSVQRVQLVPCLCPVSPDHEQGNANGPVPDNVYLKPVSASAVNNA